MEIPTLEALGLSKGEIQKLRDRYEPVNKKTFNAITAVVCPDQALRTDLLYALLSAQTQCFAYDAEMIVTIEKKTKYVPDGPAYCAQRSLEDDDVSYADAIKGALRMNPGFVLVDTISSAEDAQLVALSAETGCRMLVGFETGSEEEVLLQLGVKRAPESDEFCPYSVDVIAKASSRSHVSVEIVSTRPVF